MVRIGMSFVQRGTRGSRNNSQDNRACSIKPRTKPIFIMTLAGFHRLGWLLIKGYSYSPYHSQLPNNIRAIASWYANRLIFCRVFVDYGEGDSVFVRHVLGTIKKRVVVYFNL